MYFGPAPRYHMAMHHSGVGFCPVLRLHYKMLAQPPSRTSSDAKGLSQAASRVLSLIPSLGWN